MATKPRKPWRVIVTGPDVRAESDHTSEAKAYALIRASLGEGSPADTARVEQWEDGRWWHFETVHADVIRATQAAIRNIDEK
ncbi:hypothetical protein KVH31_34520 [Streptomyces olivaceus]|uniref:hypothetical protein n=1 Tax=Streptomyces olivaceus TaxID=47716 RepID=UPI001CCB799B|nr:hypothetical protein [Streptomyces olivaceus]MBZ6211612.1 hypothetical protein [Streptomyces olivaceus]